MKIRLISVGKTGPGEADRLAGDYIQRIRKFCPIETVEVRGATGRALRGATRSERESRSCLDALADRDLVVCLDPAGRSMTSETFAPWLERSLGARPAVAFIVGGADGLSGEARKRADLLLSLSSLTLPHELARAVLAEQIYRAFSILRGTPYHR